MAGGNGVRDVLTGDQISFPCARRSRIRHICVRPTSVLGRGKSKAVTEDAVNSDDVSPPGWGRPGGLTLTHWTANPAAALKTPPFPPICSFLQDTFLHSGCSPPCFSHLHLLLDRLPPHWQRPPDVICCSCRQSRAKTGRGGAPSPARALQPGCGHPPGARCGQPCGSAGPKLARAPQASVLSPPFHLVHRSRPSCAQANAGG